MFSQLVCKQCHTIYKSYEILMPWCMETNFLMDREKSRNCARLVLFLTLLVFVLKCSKNVFPTVLM